MQNHSLKTTIPTQWAGYRLDQVLTYLFPQYSRASLQKQVKNGHVQVNAKTTKKNSLRLSAGQTVRGYLMFEAADSSWNGDPSIPLSIWYEDEAFLVVNKPAGLVTHPGPGHPNGTLVNALLYYLPALNYLPRAGIIHRLDKDTSGLLVVPKTLITHTCLVKELAMHRIERIYQAVVKGRLLVSGSIKLPIGRHPTFRQKQAVVPQGKPAITFYRPLEHFKGYTLLSVKLETGRTHQIRVHMAYLKHAIVGDPLYGGNATSLPFYRQALHAYKLSLYHPLTSQYLSWEAPIPEDMQQLITELRKIS